MRSRRRWALWWAVRSALTALVCAYVALQPGAWANQSFGSWMQRGIAAGSEQINCVKAKREMLCRYLGRNSPTLRRRAYTIVCLFCLFPTSSYVMGVVRPNGLSASLGWLAEPSAAASEVLKIKRPEFAAVVGIICSGPNLGISLMNAWHGSTGLVFGACVGSTTLALLGHDQGPAVIFPALFVLSAALLYHSVPGLFQKLAFAILCMSLLDTLDAGLSPWHSFRLAWSGVIGALVPNLLCLIPLPGLHLPLASRILQNRLRLLQDACAIYQFALVDAFLACTTDKNFKMRSMGAALGKGFDSQIAEVKKLLPAARWEASLWDLLPKYLVTRFPTRELSTNARLDQLEALTDMLERLVGIGSGMAFALERFEEQLPPPDLVHSLRSSLLSMSTASLTALMGDFDGRLMAMKAHATAGTQTASVSSHEVLDNFDCWLEATRRELYYETKECSTEATSTEHLAAHLFMTHLRMWAAVALNCDTSESDHLPGCSAPEGKTSSTSPRTERKAWSFLHLPKVCLSRVMVAVKLGGAASVAGAIYHVTSGSGMDAALAAGNHRVSGALHTCLERVLGTVAGLSAGYLALRAQEGFVGDDDSSAELKIALNASILAIWFALCTIARSCEHDWAYAALCAAFTAPGMQLKLLAVDADSMQAIAWQKVEQNCCGLIVLMLVDFVCWPQRATELTSLALLKSMSVLSEGVTVLWTSFIAEQCPGCRQNSAGKVLALCRDASDQLRAHGILAREAVQEPVFAAPYFSLRAHEAVNLQTRRLVQLVVLMQHTLSLSAGYAEEQHARLIIPLSKPIRDLEKSTHDALNQIVSGVRETLTNTVGAKIKRARKRGAVHEWYEKLTTGLNGKRRGVCTPMRRALEEVGRRHEKQVLNILHTYKLSNKDQCQESAPMSTDVETKVCRRSPNRHFSKDKTRKLTEPSSEFHDIQSKPQQQPVTSQMISNETEMSFSSLLGLNRQLIQELEGLADLTCELVLARRSFKEQATTLSPILERIALDTQGPNTPCIEEATDAEIYTHDFYQKDADNNSHQKQYLQFMNLAFIQHVNLSTQITEEDCEPGWVPAMKVSTTRVVPCSHDDKHGA